MDCIFCKIANGEIKSDIVFKDDKCVVFRDIRPQAPVHLLVIHKDHTPNITETEEGAIFADLFTAARKAAEIEGLNTLGYRVIINNGKAAHQEVFHLHVHLLGGKEALGPMLCL